MAKSNDSIKNRERGFNGAITIAFIVLKLCHVITWSWWWVIAPLWIPWLIVGALVVICGVGYLIKRTLEKAFEGS